MQENNYKLTIINNEINNEINNDINNEINNDIDKDVNNEKANENKLPYLIYGTIFSLLVHTGVLFILFSPPSKPPKPLKVLNVDISQIKFNDNKEISPKNLANKKELKEEQSIGLDKIKNQIVDDSDIVNNKVPKKTELLSSKNNTVKKEQIKRGDGLVNNLNNNSITNSDLKKSYLNKNNKKVRPRNAKKLLSLKLDESTLLRDFASDETKDSVSDNNFNNNFNNNVNNNDSFNNLVNYEPFSRPYGSDAKFTRSAGSSMYLPNIQDGDMTLLNTKAEYFAVFVRRVATRVFSKLRQSGWESLSRHDINIINSYAKIEAKMSKSGDIISLDLISSSGSVNFDNVLKNAIKTSAKDSNPPKNAVLQDGFIYFIFQAKSWSRNGVSQNGTIGEQRWLLLSTGLK